MAIVKLGPIVSGISGKVGTVVFINAKQGLVLRPTPVTRHKTSDFLLRSQGRLSALRRHWATLTTLQQDTWRTAAATLSSTNRIGHTRPRTGFQYFILTNKIVFPGAPGIVDIPFKLRDLESPINPLIVFSLTTGLSIIVDNPASPAGMFLQVYGWPFWVNHDTKSVPRFVFLDERGSSTDPMGDTVTPEWEDHFGPVQLGQRYAIGIKAWNAPNPFHPMFVFRGTVLA